MVTILSFSTFLQWVFEIHIVYHLPQLFFGHIGLYCYNSNKWKVNDLFETARILDHLSHLTRMHKCFVITMISLWDFFYESDKLHEVGMVTYWISVINYFRVIYQVTTTAHTMTPADISWRMIDIICEWSTKTRRSTKLPLPKCLPSKGFCGQYGTPLHVHNVRPQITWLTKTTHFCTQICTPTH